MTRREILTFFFAVAFVWTLSAHPATEYVEGDAIVTFKTSANLAAAKNVLTKHSLQFAQHFAWLSERRGRHTGLVRAKTRTTAQLIAELKTDPTIESAEPNYLRWTDAIPNDTQVASQWAVQNTGQSISNYMGAATAGTSGADIKFVPAWSMARPAASQVVVGVLDTGVNYTHPDLAANMWINPGEIPGNGLDDDSDGFVDDYYGYNFGLGNANPSDSAYHGTHVAGIIAAVGNNHLGVIGIDYQAKIMALRVASVGGSISTSSVISALQYATMMKGRGVNVVALNESFGGGGSSNAEIAALQASGSAGIIVCAAAGNSGTNNDTAPIYPASYHLSNMIVVAASDQNDGLAVFLNGVGSNYGPTTVDLAAPGVNILSTAPAGATDPTEGVAHTFFQVNGNSYSPIPMTYSGTASAITGTVYNCGIGNPGDFPAGVNGNIALIQRGTLTFAAKADNAKTAGARAAIIYNGTNGYYTGTLSGTGNWIPAEAISQADGLAILAALPATGFFSSDYQFLDGTSMATPHVTGAVAFAAMNFPNESVAQRIQRILTHVDVKPGLQGKVVTGGRLNLQRIVDTDGNGLPDWWEQTYFNQIGINPGADADGDGMTNLQEFLAGTSPTDPQSALRISSILKNNTGTGFIVSWTSVPGKTYQVLHSASLLGPWLADLPNSQITAGIAQTGLSYTDTTIGTDPKRFYRVALVVP